MSTLYTATVKVTHGRDGAVRSDDGLLEQRLAYPAALGGDGKGTNPEQLFAAAYAACFGSTLTTVAKARGTSVRGVVVTGAVDINVDDGTYDLAVRLAIEAAGVDRGTLAELVELTRATCPYARAIRNNVETTIRVVDPT